jgi:hypothetical protein
MRTEPTPQVQGMGRLLRRVLSWEDPKALPWTAIYLGTTLPQPSSGLPENETSSLIVFCLTLLRTRFTEPTGSPRPLVVSYTTVSPLPNVAARRSAFCGTVSRVAPGGCYPPPCSVEPGRSSASVQDSKILRDDATVLPTHSANSIPSEAGFLRANQDRSAVRTQHDIIVRGDANGVQIRLRQRDVAAQ